ncbi:hypothetical protein BD779DRAFT_1432248 [Infundibulicybe gibba]|nr:hypothetical protein BD779DRAFT_1432248 [Infundibulicybe gibba]
MSIQDENAVPVSGNVPLDPPPPYPSHQRRLRGSRSQHPPPHGNHANRRQSTDSHLDFEPLAPPRMVSDSEEPTETTPFLAPLPSNHNRRSGRPRSGSTTSVAPSLAQTVFSLFHTEDESDYTEVDERVYMYAGEAGLEDAVHRERGSLARRWKKYFRPMSQPAYYKALFHLLVLNFPYALMAWVYLFVFTLTGTILLVALPLGAFLCFMDLLGARAFARGELFLQTRFHSPLGYPPPYPPRPIFTRARELTTAEIESGVVHSSRLERSFYKNAYAMFTDATSYQALFYFLVIKPSITLIFFLFAIIFVMPAIALILPAPAALRAARRLGAWQANIAVEGLYYAVR